VAKYPFFLPLNDSFYSLPKSSTPDKEQSSQNAKNLPLNSTLSRSKIARSDFRQEK
jgi:hypothetical protein